VRGAPAETEAPFRYRVVLDAPRALRDTLSASVGLVRWQDYADMTGFLFARLARDAIGEAREAAATQGYFSADVVVDVDRTATPATVSIRVTPGAPSTVRDVDLRVTGPAANEPAGEAVIATMRKTWGLPAGSVFRQEAWDSAKLRAVAAIAGDRYAAARLTDSRATIDPAAHAADLRVGIDSGPAFHFGPIEVRGVRRYTAEMVRNYSTLQRGSPYSIEELNQYVRRLSAAGYFSSVHAIIDDDAAHAGDAPVTVSVIEAAPKRLEVGIGFSTDTRYRANASYRDVDFASRALQFSTDLRFEQKVQSLAVRLATPPGSDGWSQAGSAQVERTDIAGLVTQTATIGYRRTSLDERDQWQYGPAMYFDRQHPQGLDPMISHALYVDVARAWRRVDDLVSPNRGWIALAQAGVGIPGVSTRGFGRLMAQLQGWRPLPGDNTLTGRLEAGAVLAGSREGVPSTLLFRTGGDQTVRGYAYQSLGVRVNDVTLPGRYYALGSIEGIHWFNDFIGGALFVDAGDAFDRFADARVAVGIGTGVRVRTPVGPIRLDVAYGERERTMRLHFSAGLAF
jgi:translocation and assembly module TamA